MRHVFMLGNKRSGTSHLVRVLNQHPQLFLAQEADLVWLLLLASRGEAPRRYPWDGPKGLLSTVAAAGDLLEEAGPALRRGERVAETFEHVALRLMRQGSAVQPRFDKPDVVCVGDKKPVQHADPDVLRFLREHFPEARYLHLVRHPRAVVASMHRRGQEGAQVPFWSERVDVLLQRWCQHEQWVLDASAALGDALLTLRYEDLVDDPSGETSRVLAHLGLDAQPSLLASAADATHAGAHAQSDDFDLPATAWSDSLMARYGYDGTQSATRERTCWQVPDRPGEAGDVLEHVVEEVPGARHLLIVFPRSEARAEPHLRQRLDLGHQRAPPLPRR